VKTSLALAWSPEDAFTFVADLARIRVALEEPNPYP